MDMVMWFGLKIMVILRMVILEWEWYQLFLLINLRSFLLEKYLFFLEFLVCIGQRVLFFNVDIMKYNLSINLCDDCYEICGLFCMDGLI